MRMDPGLLMGVLSQGKEQAMQLEAQLGEPLDVESCKLLARKVHSCYETAIAMAQNMGGKVSNLAGSDSPQSGSESPRSENSDHPAVMDHEQRELMCKKRKSLPKWSSQVRVCLGGGIEGTLDDGYSWRKYGQKDILGAKYPRGYYRCTHRNSQGCLATKQVQRSDSDPSVFDISYRGVHTCIDKRQKFQASPPKESDTKTSPPGPDQDPQLLMRFRASLKVKTEGLGGEGGQTSELAHSNSSSFTFPSTPASCIQTQSNFFLSPTMQENNFSNTISPNFMASTSSECNYFSMTQCQAGNYGVGPNVHSSESELAEIMSAATSATKSPTVDMDFAAFDPHFFYDSSNFI